MFLFSSGSHVLLVMAAAATEAPVSSQEVLPLQRGKMGARFFPKESRQMMRSFLPAMVRTKKSQSNGCSCELWSSMVRRNGKEGSAVAASPPGQEKSSTKTHNHGPSKPGKD